MICFEEVEGKVTMFPGLKNVCAQLLALNLFGLFLLFVNGVRNFGHDIGKNVAGGLITHLRGKANTIKSALSNWSDQIETDEDSEQELSKDWSCVEKLRKALVDAQDKIRKMKSKNKEDLSSNNDCSQKKNKEWEDAMIKEEKDTIGQLQDVLARQDEELERNKRKILELEDEKKLDEFYTGYLEEKVKAHEAERKKMREELERRPPASRQEVHVPRARNGAPDDILGKEAQRDNSRVQTKVQKPDDRGQSLQRDLAEQEPQIASLKEDPSDERREIGTVREEAEEMRNPSDQLGGRKKTRRRKSRRRRNRGGGGGTTSKD